MLAAEGVEAHDAAEEDGHVVVPLRGHRTLVPQLVGHGRRKDRVQQPAQRGEDKATVRDAESSFSASPAHFVDFNAMCAVQAWVLTGHPLLAIFVSQVEKI